MTNILLVPNVFRGPDSIRADTDSENGLVQSGEPADVTPIPVPQPPSRRVAINSSSNSVSDRVEEQVRYPIQIPIYRDEFNQDGSIRGSVANKESLWRRPVKPALFDVAVAGFEKSGGRYIKEPTTSYVAGSREGLLGIFKTSDANYTLANRIDSLGVSLQRNHNRIHEKWPVEEIFAEEFGEELKFQFGKRDTAHSPIDSELLAATAIQVVGSKAIVLSAFQKGFNVFCLREGWRGGFGAIVRSIPVSRDIDNGLLRGELSGLQAGDKIVLTSSERVARKDVLAGRACVEAMANSIASHGGPTIVASIKPTSLHSR